MDMYQLSLDTPPSTTTENPKKGLKKKTNLLAKSINRSPKKKRLKNTRNRKKEKTTRK